MPAQPSLQANLKFGTVSVISTVIAQSVLLLTFDVGHIASAMVCNVIATAVATVPAYWLNRTWTWGKRGKSHLWREVAPFWIIAFIGLVLSTLAVGVAAHNADRVSSSQEVKDLFVHGANFVTYGLIWLARYSIFNKFMFGPQASTTVAQPGERRGSAGRRGQHRHTASPRAPGSVLAARSAAASATSASADAGGRSPRRRRRSAAGRLSAHERLSTSPSALVAPVDSEAAARGDSDARTSSPSRPDPSGASSHLAPGWPRSPAPALRPPPVAPAVVVFAGDHGVLAEGVTPWPAEVTAQMVANFLSGGAAINAIAGEVGAAVTVVDVGVATPIPPITERRRSRAGSALIQANVRAGTANLALEPAMSPAEAAEAHGGRCRA